MNPNEEFNDTIGIRENPSLADNVNIATTGQTTAILQETATSKYPTSTGGAALRKQYGHDKRYEKFFVDLEIDPQTNDIKLDHKLFRNDNGNYTLTAEHNGKDIFSGDFEDSNGKKGISGLTYMMGVAGRNQAKKQNKMLFKTGEQVDAFIDQFPGERIGEKIFSFVTLFGLQNSGFWAAYNNTWVGVGYVGFATLSSINSSPDINSKLDVRGVTWRSDDRSMEWSDSYPKPVLAFEDC